MAFGGGVHKCIGLYFAQIEVKTNTTTSFAPSPKWASKYHHS
jgi:cytochrome P450